MYPIFLSYLEPILVLEGDDIIRIGEIADEMYFIKKGLAEVIATDGKTRISVLKEGSYFGEIGLFLTGKRSVSVRALSPCVLLRIKKKDLDWVLEGFPEIKKLLRNVAKQRIKTSKRNDIVILLDCLRS